MKVVITAATELEFASACAAVKQHPNKHKIIFHKTGVGLLSCAVKLTKLIHNENPALIVQGGIAGAFDTSMDLGKVVVISEEQLADMGVEENNQWKDIFDLNLELPNNYPFENGKLPNPWLTKFNLLQLPEVTGVTVNEITTGTKRIQQIKQKYNPAIESMEGAALHYVCREMNTPFLQIRSVSNYVGERDKSKWKMKKAIDNLNQAVIHYLDQLNKIA